MRRILLAALLLASCASVDMRQKVARSGAGSVDDLPAVTVVPVESSPPGVIEIEKPVYVPSREKTDSPPPEKGKTAVQLSNREGIIEPSRYSHAAMVYDYQPDQVYEVYTQPLRASDICLEPGEKATEAPFISDSERWMLGAGVSQENTRPVQHIYVKPADVSLEASLIINTDRRVYHIILKSFKDVHMPVIRWRYPSPGLPQNYIPSAGPPGSPGDAPTETGFPGVDPRFLSFNYFVSYGFFQKPDWLPELVYDDAKKTYILFPKQTLQRELPGVFENRGDLVNYRVVDNLVIIDKLIEKITLKIGEIQIVIEKIRGK
jgi:type IV secretion system protein VirB9